MSANSCLLDVSPAAAASDAPAMPFAAVYVTLTKQEYIQLISDANRYKSLHERALTHALWRKERYRRFLRQMKDQAAQREAALRAELETAQAKVRDLQQRVFGRKSEATKGASEAQSQGCVARAPRGHKHGARGHGRTMQENLPQRHEYIEIEAPHCPRCGLGLSIFPGTEDSSVVEIEVKAYRRVIHRKRYSPVCNCGCLGAIVAAPVPSKLIAKGKFGVSVWTSVLLDKFLYGRPSHRLLQDLAGHGLNMSPGTLAGGLQTLASLFEPIEDALLAKLRSEAHWHADETRWAVFIDVHGKVNHRWYRWVFHSSSVVHYVLDKTRSAQVVTDELAGVERGIISCDRYSAYKKFARLNPAIVLAFCWVHQRRDFLELANSYRACAVWAFEWLDAIGELYHLNGLRLRTTPGSAERVAAQSSLERAVQRMADKRDAALANPLLVAPAAGVLKSMQAHWCGLTVFVRCPWVSMDNNAAERDIRGPVIGRKNFYGSGAQWSGELAASLYSVMATLKLYKLNARTWLGAYLQACADNAQQAPRDISVFLPWAMDAKRLAYMRAGPTGAPAAMLEELNSS